MKIIIKEIREIEVEAASIEEAEAMYQDCNPDTRTEIADVVDVEFHEG